MQITGIYAALGALLLVFLAARVMRRRTQARIGIGDGGDHELLKRIRVHANAVEYLPISLILLLLVELGQTRPLLVHAFGILVLAGRVLHAFGLSKTSKASFGRVGGMLLGLVAIVGMAVLLLWRQVAMATMQ